jgi:cell division protein FtsW
MSAAFLPEKVRGEKTDLLLLTVLVLLVGLGTAVLFSASYFTAERLSGSPYFFLQKQLVLLSVGTVGAWFLSRLNLDLVRRAVPVLLGISALLMIVVFLPVWDAGEILGARRWIVKFGLSFQPSELAKLTVVLYLASMFAKKEGDLNDVGRSLLPPFAVSFVFVGLTLLQNDYSTAMFLLFVILVLFFLADVKLRYWFTVLGCAVGLGVFGVLSAPYRVERVLTFLNPHRDPSGASFQIQAARDALVAGGFFGTGFGAGVHKLGGVPYVYNDFVLASVAEETGFWGVTLVFVLFGLLAWRGYEISLAQKDTFRRITGLGITTFLVYQVLINAAVVAGAVPATGVTLPFFSYGGSSVVISLFMGGILLNLSRGISGSVGALASPGSSAYGRTP